MKPADFEYVRPATIAEAVGALSASDGDGKILAGGQSLVPLMNFRLASPAVIVDLNRLTALSHIDADAGRLRIGAMTRTRRLELEPLVRRSIPILPAAASWVGHVQIRNRGTVGGSLAHADPAAELPAVCLLLDAEVVAVGPRGERVIPVTDLLDGFLTTTLADDEILTEVRIPIPAASSTWGFAEFAPRRGDFALAGAAVLVDGTPTDPAPTTRIVVFGTADRPRRAAGAEALLGAQPLSAEGIPAAAAMAAEEAIADDPRQDAGYRRHLTEALVRRALEDAAGLGTLPRGRVA